LQTPPTIVLFEKEMREKMNKNKKIEEAKRNSKKYEIAVNTRPVEPAPD
jgi:hypothetical protein